MKFIVDTMLGRLAKWLRLLGYDTAYPIKDRLNRRGNECISIREADDETLLRVAEDEERVLLTRDKDLAHASKSRCIQTVYIVSEFIDNQLKQVVRELKLDIDEKSLFSRCAECNTELLEVEKFLVREAVPETVYFRHDRFWKCPRCEKYYWQGTHWEEMMHSIEGLKRVTTSI
jgi:hypothetical protein